MFQALWDFIGRNAEQLVALVALVVAVGSFWVQRKHNRLSVKPHLITFTEIVEAKKHVLVRLKNNGLGPALIKSFEFRFDGKIKNNGSPYKVGELIDMLLKGVLYRSTRTHLGTDYAMPANESMVLVDIELMPTESLSLFEVKKRLERIDLIVKYESFYGAGFVLDTSTDTPTNQPLQEN